MTELKCGFCRHGKEVKEECGELHHVVTASGKPCTAHHKCMQYSALLVQYKSEHFGGFKISKVFEELARGRSSKCFICKCKRGRTKSGSIRVTGATCGCAVKQCRKTFHYYCAKTSQDCITKRLVVSFKNKNKITVLYRVFCSKEHEVLYRRNLKEYSKDMNKSAEESEEDSDIEDSNKEDVNDDEDLLLGGFDLSSQMLSQQMNENGHDTSFIPAYSNTANGSTTDIPNNRLKRSASHNSLVSDEKPPKSVKLDKKKVIGLCILSSDENLEAQRKEIHTILKNNYDVNEVVIWQDVTSYTLNSDLTPYFIHAISKAVRSNSYKNLQNLLFSEKYLRDKCVSDYEYQSNFIQDLKDPAVAKNVLQSTWKSVSKNLQDASISIGKEIGSVIPVYSSNVLLLLVGDEIDKNSVIRQKLQHLFESIPKPAIFVWKNDTRLKKYHTEDFDENEVDILLSNIIKNKSEIGEIIDEPKDKILLRSNTQSNVVSCIYKGLEGTDIKTDQDKSHCLVLISQLDSTIVNSGNYIIKLLHNILTDNHNKYSKFSMVLPVFSLQSTFNIVENIKNCVDFDVTVAIYSAYNPEKQSISYIVAEIMISNQSAANSLMISSSQSVTECRPCVEDNERPSTSGSNKKRRLRPTLSPSALSLQHMLKQSS
ncbi:hypothetical protein LOTGIDRAFT_229704 [Lottia gigantea]|uniref:PHD-type domain-containing protein n=1 Tax=Lottia gigantea TaxID=225164 RepID=V3ZJ14_LOTGI|nr:hypothetical protein LOTGIDRAFT_229704 [Lottia gigantea]ESO84252.1 hypothetical protein LOTGIDRAFT_229704 [Lottia gigantea]